MSRILSITAILLGPFLTVAAEPIAGKKPNVVFILTDDRD